LVLVGAPKARQQVYSASVGWQSVRVKPLKIPVGNVAGFARMA
jgi:hypothetical protein